MGFKEWAPKNKSEKVVIIYVASLFPFLALWGNKNWLPSMKMKKMETYQDKSGSTGYKWSSLIAPGTGNPLSHSVLGLEEFPFPIIGPLG